MPFLHATPARRLAVLLLAASLLLAGCGSTASSEAAEMPAAPADDSIYVMPRPAEEGLAVPEGAGAPIALAMGAEGTENGRNVAVQNGMQAFAGTYGYTVRTYVAEEDGAAAAQQALTDASQCGPSIVVCVGEEMATALHVLQGDYPTVGYLLLDAEPHSEDYGSYAAAPNVHSVLFQEEQAAYLAGYAAVADGYTKLAFLGGLAMPGTVRYCAGFLQGAQAAASTLGCQVEMKVWYSGMTEPGQDLSARLSGWYSEGTELIMAGTEALTASCIEATATAGAGKVIATGWDHSTQDPAVLTTAADRYGAVVQSELYSFLAAGGAWGEDCAGKSARLGTADDAVALPTADWRFASFDAGAYAQLYERLRNGEVTVEAISDSAQMPATSNVTVQMQN